MRQPQRESRIEAAPRVAPQENARAVPENTRTAPWSRTEPFESRAQERPNRREEPAMRSPQREARSEVSQQQVLSLIHILGEAWQLGLRPAAAGCEVRDDLWVIAQPTVPGDGE